MNRHTRQVSYFLSSQHFSNGLRTTLSILLPSLLLAQAGQLPSGMAMSIGALSVSLSDAPGPVRHRRNGMAATALIGSLVALVTGFARLNDYTLGLEIGLFSFLFSLFAVYGTRATSVGTAALLVMILMIDRPLDAEGVLLQSGLILAGGAWYTLISLLAFTLQPYRSAQQALGQCIHEIAKFLAIKADFYQITTSLDDNYRRLVAQQVAVSEKQNDVRELLFKTRQFVTESTGTSRLLVLTFIDAVDLYEQIVAMYYDYNAIRERFGKTDILNDISTQIRRLSAELDHIGLTVQTTLIHHRPIDLMKPLDELKRHIDGLGDSQGSTLILKKVVVSLRTISQRLTTIQGNIATPDVDAPPAPDLEYGRFVSHQLIDTASLLDNLTLESSAFRHSIRVALAMLFGFIITKFLNYGHHSYWILLTISVILKPAFSLTKQRNTERIIGTFAGGLIGILILTVVPNQTAQLVLMVLLMIGTYSAQRVNYIVMVICLTPFVLILFNLLGTSYFGVAEERLLDTLLGGLIALAAGYLLFPQWESEQLTKPMQAVLKANVRYVQILLDALSGRTISVVDYKLARKDVYVMSANLSAAFERMVSEPKHKQRNGKLIYKYVVLNHVLSANVATVISALLATNPKTYPATLLKPVKRALFVLTESLHRWDSDTPKPSTELLSPPDTSSVAAVALAGEDFPMNEQLNFIQQTSSDISKLAERVAK